MSKKKKLVIGGIAAAAIAILAGLIAMTVLLVMTVPKDMQYKVETVAAESEDKIEVGIISDTQFPQVEKNMYPWDYETVTNGPSHFIKALKYFKKKNVDMIILNGDVVNSAGDSSGYNIYNDILDYVYGKDRKDMPHFIFPMGNHEYYGGNQEYQFYKATGLPLNTRTILNGYSFISLSNSKLETGDTELAASNGTLADGTYNDDRIKFLEEQLASAAKDDASKPIFLFMHMPLGNELVGGHWATPQYEKINSILEKYPQAIVFTGHSHYPLSDERSITQNDFTTVNTGCASYFDFDWIKEEDVPVGEGYDAFVNGTHEDFINKDYLINPEYIGIESSADVPFRNMVNNGLILSIDCIDNEIELQRINFTTGLEFGDSFVMTEFTKDTFVRTPDKLGKGSDLQFDSDATVSAKVLPDGRVGIQFDAVNQDDVAKYYQYEIIDSNGKITIVRFFARNYYLGMDGDYQEQNILHKLTKGDYSMKVYAINSMNTKSTEALSTSFTI